jgi:glycosidase
MGLIRTNQRVISVLTIFVLVFSIFQSANVRAMPNNPRTATKAPHKTTEQPRATNNGPHAATEAPQQSPVISGNEVTFYYKGTGNETTVLLAGDFNDWATEGEKAIHLEKGGDNVWSATIQLEHGSFTYKYVVDGQWIADPLNPHQMDDGYGGKNSFVTVGETADSRKVVLVGDLQDELGHSSEWDPAAQMTEMTHIGNDFYMFKGRLPKGTYHYKIAINGSWSENYGAGGQKDGPDITLNVEEDREITFYYHDKTHKIADSTYYQMIPVDQTPRLVGDLQPEIGAGSEWNPAESTAFLLDDDFDNIYTYKTSIPKGKHEFKIVLGDKWEGTEAYPANNCVLNVLEDTEITFSFDNKIKTVLTDYHSGGSDGVVNKEKLYHHTWETAYRKPFGAVQVGETITFRLSAKKDDLTRASVYIKNYLTGNSKMIKMSYAGWMDVEGQGKVDFWEASFTPSEKGVHGYKFIVGDQEATAEYGEDTTEGGTGVAVNKNAGLFQLTVYDPDYRTPDWMKEAIVYQIFPDRFFNGNEKNDDAKKYARGYEPIERTKSWYELPDNPRIKEKDPSQYTGDGIWSNDFFGGDIAGIQKKLDYLQSLGVNTIYLNPIAYAASNHKYDATNYQEIDPMFGTPEEFEAFTKELGRRGMHLILDGVFNHVADDSIYFDRYGKYDIVGAYEYWSTVYDLMNEKGLSLKEAEKEATKKFKKEGQKFSRYEFHHWFHIENEKVDVGTPNERYKYQAWWGFDSLPEIKSVPGKAVDHDSELNNKPFAKYIMYENNSVAKLWIKRGGSGWRLDVANEVDMEFWREFRKELKNQKLKRGATLKNGEEPLILGEIWDDASKYFIGDQYDSVMNYRFERAVMDFLKNGKAENAEAQLKAVQEDYPKEAFYALMNLMGSHDTPRAIFLLGNGTDTYERAEWDPNYNHELGKKRLKLAAIFQMGYPGAPTIYYGDEAGVTGSKDPDDRRTYPWGKEDKDLLRHYQTVGKIRQKHKDLFAYGDLFHVYAKDDVFVYLRKHNEKAAIIAINRGNENQTVTVNLKQFIPNGVTLTDELNQNYQATTKDGKVEFTIPAMTGRMLMSEKWPALPEKVEQLQATEGFKSVTLSWNGKAKQYAIYQTNIEGVLFEKIGTTSETTFTINNLQNGRKYYFAVASVDSNGNEAEKAVTNAVIPHVDLSDAWIGSLTQLENRTLDLSKAVNVKAELYVKGVTETSADEGVTVQLEVRKQGDNDWHVYKAEYSGQNGSNNIFSAKFLPLESGTYEYRFAFSPDLGRNWKYTETILTTFIKDRNDSNPPAEKIELQQPLQESGQVNLHWNLIGEDDPFLLTIVRNGQLLEILQDTAKTTYRDYDVENGKTYSYVVNVYDKAGNVTTSDTVSVTPDQVMVKVTFKVKAPDYTPLTTNISIPNSINGWNTGAWQMTRNGAVTPDWEYTTELEEGTEITYKYVKGGSWDQEGLADHTPNNPNDDDVSFYGYGAIGTDLKVVVQNEGNNEMVIQDYILRWIDMPVVITSPQNGATVNSDSVEFKGNAIKGGMLTINGQTVKINEDMTFSHTVPLQKGENQFTITIEPSQESKTNIFKNDGGAIAKNTKSYTYVIYRE